MDSLQLAISASVFALAMATPAHAQNFYVGLGVEKGNTSVDTHPGSLDGDIILDDSRVSRRHAQITREAGAFLLRDLDSANGVWVNGVRVTEQPLQEGDVISLGGVELVFKWT